MINRFCIFFVYLWILFFPAISFAQEKDEVTDDLGNVTDEFQEHFFEALKQKGIENYDRAIISLEKAAKVAPDAAVIYFEMAKNQVHLKKYEAAEMNYKKVLQMRESRPEIYEGLYDVYYNTQDYEQAIETVKKLIPYDTDYKEDLANLYVRTERYKEALAVLDELDRDLGNSDYRNQLRQQIYSASSDSGNEIADLERRIERNPENEQDFLNLIFLYSEEGNAEAAFKTAEKLLKAKPDSELVHLALYKFYLGDNQIEKAMKSMKVTFSSPEVDMENKYRVLNDFLIFVNENPVYEEQLQQMVVLFSENEETSKVYQLIGEYYLNKKMPSEALKYFQLGLSKKSTDFDFLKNTILMQLETGAYAESARLSAEALDIFPSQPVFYLMNGVAHNNLGDYIKAINSLEAGLDYLIDDPVMESDFYKQLSAAHRGNGNISKAEEFNRKAQKLSPNN